MLYIYTIYLYDFQVLERDYKKSRLSGIDTFTTFVSIDLVLYLDYKRDFKNAKEYGIIDIVSSRKRMCACVCVKMLK